MNKLPTETRIDLLAIAIVNLIDALEDVVARLPAAGREGPDYADLNEWLAAARKCVKRCREA